MPTCFRPTPRRHPLALAILVAIPSATVMPVWAQQAGDEVSPSILDTITVTAQRRAEDAREVPVAITTVGGEKLAVIASGGEDVRFLSSRLPSLQIESSFGRAFPRFYIRGLGNTDFDLNASQPVSLIYDEVVQENPLLKGYPVFDLERIEMLRGPQGTLFGRNTPAGVLKFESAKPSQDADGYARGSYGSFGTANVEAAYGGPLNANWSARAAVLYQRRSDWVDNAFTGQKDALEGYREYAARVQFLYENREDFSALFNLHNRSLDGTARLFRANIIGPGTNTRVGDFDRRTVAIDGDNFQELDAWGGSARLRWDFAGGSLHSVTGYETVDSLSRGDIDGGFGAAFAPPSGPGFIPFPAESADGLPKHRQISQELRWESNTGTAWDYQAGLFYFDEDITIDSFNYDTLAPGRPQNGYAVQRQKNTAWAAFGSLEYQATDALKLRGGLRYTHDKKDFVAERTQSPIGAGPIGPLHANPSDSNLSGDLSAVWAVGPDTNLFARLARGFRAPSIQGRLLFGDTVSVADSETVTSIEAGVKSDLWDRRARIGFTLFRYEVRDQQLTAVGGAANFNTLVNADKTVGQGAELDFEAYLTDHLLVTFGASYNDTEIRDDQLAIQPCGSGCTVLNPPGPVPGTVLIGGNPLPQAPKRVANLTARYGIPMGEGGEFFVYTDWAYRSEVSFFLYQSVEFTGKSLTEGGLRVGYNWNYGDYEVALFGRNITDRVVIVGGIDFNNLTGFVNEPRIWGAEFVARF